MFARVARVKMAGPALSRLRQTTDTGALKQGRFSDANADQTLLGTIAPCFIAKIVHRAECTVLVRQMVAVANAIRLFLAMIALVAHHTISAMIALYIAKMLSRVEDTGLVRQMVAVANVMLTFLVKIAPVANPLAFGLDRSTLSEDLTHIIF